MIYLTTGTPGAGKTLWMVKKVIEELVPTGRQIFHNINGLQLDAIKGVRQMQIINVGEDGPSIWEDFPDGSICVFDEVQRRWPAERSANKSPESVIKLDTHRHRGFDFYIVTQSPMGIDPRVRRLVEEHTHLSRQFGLKGSVVRRWNGVNSAPDPNLTSEDAAKRVFKFPRKLFDYYQSASIHTDKPSIPLKFILLPLLAVSMIGLSLFLLNREFGPNSDFQNPGGQVVDVQVGGDTLSCFPIVSQTPLIIAVGQERLRVDTGMVPVSIHSIPESRRVVGCFERSANAEVLPSPN